MILRRIYAVLFVSVIALTLPPAHAATIIDIDIDNKGRRYNMVARMQISARADIVLELMKDYNRLTGINPYLLESRIMSKTGEETRVSMITKTCFMLICYKMKHVQDFAQIDEDTIQSLFITEYSDFKHGWTRWKASDDIDNGKPVTLLTIEVEVEPDFFIMPVIGPRILKDKLIEVTEVTVRNLETKAKQIEKQTGE